MPESRLARMRQTLPAGYQFTRGHHLLRRPCGCYTSEQVDGTLSMYWCEAHRRPTLSAYDQSASDRLDGYRTRFAQQAD